MIHKIKFDYFENGRFGGTMEMPLTLENIVCLDNDSTPIISTENILDYIMSKRPTLNRDKITISVYKC